MLRDCGTPWTLQDAATTLIKLHSRTKPTPPRCLAYNPDSASKCDYVCDNANNTVLRMGRGFQQKTLNGVRGIQDWLLTQGTVVASIQVRIVSAGGLVI